MSCDWMRSWQLCRPNATWRFGCRHHIYGHHSEPTMIRSFSVSVIYKSKWNYPLHQQVHLFINWTAHQWTNTYRCETGSPRRYIGGNSLGYILSLHIVHIGPRWAAIKALKSRHLLLDAINMVSIKQAHQVGACQVGACLFGFRTVGWTSTNLNIQLFMVITVLLCRNPV